MKIKNSIFITILCVVMSLFVFCACSNDDGGKNALVDTAKPTIICTDFPQYDWVCEIVGDKAQRFEIILLNDNGVDMHSFQPSVDDIVKLNESELVISVGSTSEKWINETLENSAKKSTVHIKLTEAIGDGKLLLNDGRVCEEEHDHDCSDEVDEHVWLSLENAKTVCGTIAEKITTLDSENAEYYAENLKNYTDKLDELTSKLNDGVKSAHNKILIFADRFPFRYLLNDFGIEYYAAFEGCSSDSEASFETIAFLASKLDETDLDTVMTADGSDGKLAETVIASTKSKNQKILKLDSMQSVGSDDIENGTSYISVMEKNIDTIISALN